MGLSSIVRQSGSAEGWGHLLGAVRGRTFAIVPSPRYGNRSTTTLKTLRESSPPSCLAVSESSGIVLEGTAIEFIYPFSRFNRAKSDASEPGCVQLRFGNSISWFFGNRRMELTYGEASLFCAVLGHRYPPPSSRQSDDGSVNKPTSLDPLPAVEDDRRTNAESSTSTVGSSC
jgi:hypothetical protein